MGDADSALDDAIVAIGVGAFPSNAFWFFITSIVVVGSTSGRVHFSLLFCRYIWVGIEISIYEPPTGCVGEEAAM